MFTVYAVVLASGVKHRHVLQSFYTLVEAKHMANRATSGNANYAYIKDSTGGTVFYLAAPVNPYGEGNLPLTQCRPADQASAAMLSRRDCPEQRSLS